MDRQIIYPGQIPLDTDLLNTNKNAMVALGKLAGAALGTATVVNGLAVTPTSPSSLNVQVAPGEIYALQNIDNTPYGSLSADTADQVVKQGVQLAVTTLSCPAPGTAGLSINYLVQAAFSEADAGSVALPYYNASNPAQAWSGANNNGAPQPTVRQNLCVVSVVAGAAAATGTQTTPNPAAGAIGLAVVTVANGQANITSANISQYAGAALVPQSGLASNVAHAIYTRNVAGNTDVTLTAQEAAYPLLTLTGALTGNINLIVPAVSRQRVINNQTTGAAYNVTVKTSAGTGLAVPQGQTMSLYCDGVNVLNESSASLMPAPYADATGTSDAITAGYSVNNTVLYDGYPLAVGINTPNATTTPTFAPTLNGIAQTPRPIVRYIANNAVPLAPGDLQGDAELRYDLPNTRWVLQNPGSVMAGQTIAYADATGTSDAITASYTVANPILTDGYPLSLGITTPNTTATPTFAPTLNGVAQTARTIWKFSGNAAVALAPGDLQGSVSLQYDLPNTRWILLTPGTNTVLPGTIIDYAGATPPNGYLACPVAASNLTITQYPALFAAIGITWGYGAPVTAGSFVIGTTYVITALGTTNFTLIGAASNTVGTAFVATGAGTGTGTASTTFGMPWFPADYAAVQANANVGTQSVGAVIAHTHTVPSGGGSQTLAAGGNLAAYLGGQVTGSTGGSANLAAGIRVLKCVKY